MGKALTIIVAACFLALPGLAVAQSNAELDQYFEQTPGAGGGRPSAGPGSEPAGPPLPAEDARALSKGGPPGAKAAALAEKTAPPRSAPEAADLVSTPSDDDGMGFLLPLILGASALAAAAFVIIRRRRLA